MHAGSQARTRRSPVAQGDQGQRARRAGILVDVAAFYSHTVILHLFAQLVALSKSHAHNPNLKYEGLQGCCEDLNYNIMHATYLEPSSSAIYI